MIVRFLMVLLVVVISSALSLARHSPWFDAVFAAFLFCLYLAFSVAFILWGDL
jgi:hypothetical protein